MSNRSPSAYVILALASITFPACAPHGSHESATQSRTPAQTNAAQSPAPGKYVPASAVDLRTLLPNPSPDGSPLSRAEVELVMAFQADAAQAARSRALAEEDMTPWIFADVLGPDFNPQRMPRTAALLNQATADTKAVSDQAKSLWSRKRPPQQDPRVKTLTHLPTNASYPSGHATRAAVWGRVLSLIVPDHADAIAARARLVATDRVVAGVHFPSDVAAGIALGNAIADRMVTSPAFQSDLEAARKEWGQ